MPLLSSHRTSRGRFVGGIPWSNSLKRYCRVAIFNYWVLFAAVAEWPSRDAFGQQLCEGLFPLAGRRCHAFKNDWRALFRHRFAGTVNLPSPWLRRVRSSLHGKRIISWVKFFTHASKNGGGRINLPVSQYSQFLWPSIDTRPFGLPPPQYQASSDVHSMSAASSRRSRSLSP